MLINDELKTATDDTIHLEPGNYDVKLEKDGYTTWNKLLKIEKELVTQTNARLFPSVPNLSALTVNGASKPLPSPDGHKIAYKIASGSAQTKYGIWVQSLSNNPLRFGSSSYQIVADTPNLQFSQAQLFWTPDSNQLLAYFDDTQMYLLNTNQLNESEDLINAAFQIQKYLADWQQQLTLENSKKIQKLPEEMQQIATTSATLLYFSPDEEKLLYTATASATISDKLLPPLPAINSQPQDRQLEAGNLYIYDSKEDTNFLLMNEALNEEQLQSMINTTQLITPEPINPLDAEATQSANQQVLNPIIDNRPILEQLAAIQSHYSPLYSHNLAQWFPNSQHLIVNNLDRISIIEYDGTNDVTIFSGILAEDFAYPWPDGSQLVILTSLSTDPAVPANLYAVGLE